MANNQPVYVLTYNYLVAPTNGLQLRHRHAFVVLPEPEPGTIPPGTSFGAISVTTRGMGLPGSTTLLAGTAAYTAVFLDISTTFLTIESIVLLYYPNGKDSAAIRIASADLTDTTSFPELSGTGSFFTEAQQSNISFNDSRGRISRLTIAEHAQDTSSQLGFPSLNQDNQNYITYVTGSTSIVRGVGGAEIQSLSRWNFTHNNRLERRRFR